MEPPVERLFAECQPGADVLCRKCGYALRGLTAQTCPECGTSFDLADPTTFDTVERRSRRRRKRWIVATSAAMALLVGGYLFAPRTVYTADITFTCVECGRVLTVQRWEPGNAKLGFRFPGLSWRSETSKAPASASQSIKCSAFHNDNVQIRFRNPNTRSARATHTTSPGTKHIVVVNGAEATPAGAATLLKDLMAPTNFGISIGGRESVLDASAGSQDL